MIKVLGSILVLFSCSLIGILIARSYSLRPLELRCLQSSLQMLETEIIYTATPLIEAFKQVALRSDKRVAPFFECVCQELLSFSGCSAYDAWEKALMEFYPQSALLKNDLAILRSLGGALGISDRQDQSKHLRLTIEQLGMELIKAQNDASKHVKMWNYLGFLSGLVVVLLLF